MHRTVLGIPFAAKDNLATRASDHMPTTASSRALQGAIAYDDADVIAAMREAGAIVLAKAAMSEWATYRGAGLPDGWGGMQGQTLSAYGLRANPCGSSAGSAVTSSVGLCAAAL
jgi:amidase